ncbi:MAG: hypothetical protein H6661_10800 [Ardenticatenaceae bacterium]|nr:hypothetical protein [Ardenticatenaceae bacterium]
MGYRFRRVWCGLVLLAALGGILAACQPETAVPTLAVVVAVPTAVGSALPNANLPATFTPGPETAVTSTGDFSAAVPLEATPTPTLGPNLPTSSPWPSRTATPSVTPDATVTPTRYASFISDLPPSSELGTEQRLGIHVVRNNDPAIMEFVRRSQPAVVKAVDDVGFLEEVKAVSPRTITIGRLSARDQSYAGVPEETARDFVEYQLERYLANPYVDYWEGWNEPDPNLDNMAWYARFEQERVRLLASYGLKAAVGGFATGVPELNEFELFVPAIETAIEYGGILSLHEYSAPDMTYLYGDPLPGYPAYPDRGSLTFRYRWYYREILEPAGLVLPLVISEAGIDGIIGGRPGPEGKGWADFKEYWVQQGWADTGEEAFIKQLNWYDNGVRQDGYVIGFAVFTAGPIGQWEEYSINGILPELADYVISQR